MDRADAPPKNKESRRRSFLKTLSWRAIATFTTFLVAWRVTGDLTAGLTIGGIEAVVKMFLYYLHERVWAGSRQGSSGGNS